MCGLREQFPKQRSLHRAATIAPRRYEESRLKLTPYGTAVIGEANRASPAMFKLETRQLRKAFLQANFQPGLYLASGSLFLIAMHSAQH